MKMLTDIDKSDYLYCLEEDNNELSTALEAAIANGIQLEGLTNGEIIMKLFPNGNVRKDIYYNLDGLPMVVVDCGTTTLLGEITVFKDFWDAKWGEQTCLKE